MPADPTASHAALLDELVAHGIASPRVLAAVAAVPHERFATDAAAAPSPLLVARVAETMELRPTSRVLEVGSVSTYATAVLARLAATVVSVAATPAAAESAYAHLVELGVTNARVLVGTGWFGCPELAPYDAICTTMTAPAAPKALLAQLAVHGRLVVPIGAAPLACADVLLLRVRRTDKGTYVRDELGVPSHAPSVRPGPPPAPHHWLRGHRAR